MDDMLKWLQSVLSNRESLSTYYKLKSSNDFSNTFSNSNVTKYNALLKNLIYRVVERKTKKLLALNANTCVIKNSNLIFIFTWIVFSK